MSKKYTADELNTLGTKELTSIILSQQEQMQNLNDSLEKLIEQIRIANNHRFGRSSEKLDVIDGQLDLFNEAEAFCNLDAKEPSAEEVVKSYTRKKQKGKRDADLEGLPTEDFPHEISAEKLDDH